MKKLSILLLLSFFYSNFLKSQGGGGVTSLIVALSQRSTVLYTDTTFEVEGLKFKVNETYAFRNKIKTTIYLTNSSDNYKIINSEDFTITDSENKAIIINSKRPIVVAPKTSKRIGLMAESNTSFKLYDIKIGLKQIYSTAEPIAVIKPGLFNLHEEGFETSNAGPVTLTRTKCNAVPSGGFTKVYFKLSYTGSNFLAIYGSKAMLLSADLKAYLNIAQKSKITFYPNHKTALNLVLEFDNPAPIFFGTGCDKISLENVFVEYEKKSDNKQIEFHVYKKELTKGDSPKENKETETPED